MWTSSTGSCAHEEEEKQQITGRVNAKSAQTTEM
jgi:hypothetical protein